jgi:hypothetical protein
MVVEKGRRVTVKFGETNNLEIDAVQMPNGEVRYTFSSVSVFLGKNKQYIQGSSRNRPETLKRWQDKGFRGQALEVAYEVSQKDRISTVKANTLSGSDLDAIVSAEAQLGNGTAIALLQAGFSLSRQLREADAIGLPQISSKRQREIFTESFELAYSFNREDLAQIEQQELFLADQETSFLPVLTNFKDGKAFHSNYYSDPDCYQPSRRVSDVDTDWQ